MNLKQFLLILLQETMMLASPLQRQYLQALESLQPHMLIPMPMTQQNSLQQQLLALQQLQDLQADMKTLHAPSRLYLPQPMIVILPDSMNSLEPVESNDKIKRIDNKAIISQTNPGKVHTDVDLDSVVIDAEQNSVENIPQRAVFLLPNGRFSIGQIISAIPFLPIEINVPDTISWIYNGIAGIISGIGQRLPFRRPQTTVMMPSEMTNLRMVLQKLRYRNQNQMMPVVVMPIMEGPMEDLMTMEEPSTVTQPEESLQPEHKSS